MTNDNKQMPTEMIEMLELSNKDFKAAVIKNTSMSNYKHAQNKKIENLSK